MLSAEHTVPIALVSQLVQVVRRWNVSAVDLLRQVGWTEAILEDPLGRVPLPIMCSLLAAARVMTGEPGLGYYLGQGTRVTIGGYLGFAGLSALTVGDAIRVMCQFAPLFSTALEVELRVEGRLASLYFEERADLGGVRDIILINILVGLRSVGRSLTGRDTGGSADYAFPEPEYHTRFAHMALYSRFDQPHNRIVFDAEVLKFPIVTGDPVALQLAERECERELDRLAEQTPFVDCVRRLMQENEIASLVQLAARLETSPRTLRRRLAADGVSFSALVDDGRRVKALRLVRSSRLSIEDVARRLGYAAPSTFARAFQRWTGQTPTQYRRGSGAP
jgi:AraC-like DNA-binding protein